jgi:hypothetical protein
MKTMRALTTTLFSLSLLACGSSPPPEPPPPPPPPPAPAPPPVPEATAAPTATAAAETPKIPVEITAMQPPAAPEKMPSIKVSAPKANESIPADKAEAYEVKLEIKDWPVQKGGPHVHLIVDNKPYFAVFDPKATVKLADVVGGEKLAEGEHVLVAFPSRETHISVKPEGKKSPLVIVPFWIGKKGKATFKPTDPMLVYSRPKGTYQGDMAKSVALDFYLSNVELGEGKYTVGASVAPPTGEARSITVTSWTPFAITNLPDGDSHVKLELRDKSGNVVPGIWGSAERTITIKH